MSVFPPEVVLVGAGPGDARLLTQEAISAIAAGSLLLVDDLVSETVLTHAKPSARIVHVGKRGGCQQSTPQEKINAMMVEGARAGENVVRIKGGDPLILGRAGEEIAYLKASGFAVRVMNGITSGLAAAAALGISLTHRACARGVVFVTGHTQFEDPARNRECWRTLAGAANTIGLTLVIYMGLHAAAEIEAELLAGGLAPSTPAALLQNISLPDEKIVRTQLGQLTQSIAEQAIASPLIMIIGAVLEFN